MNCQEFEDALADALSGDPAGPASAEAASHLRSCKACQGRARQVLRLHESLHQSLSPYPSSLDERMTGVLEGMDRDLRSSKSDLVAAAQARIEKLPRRTGWRGPVFIAAAALLAVALTLTLWPRSPGQPASITRSDDSQPLKETEERPAERRPADEKARKEELDRLREEQRRVEERRARLERESRDLLEAQRKDSPESLAESRKAQRELEAKLAELAAREKAAEAALETARPKEKKDPEPAPKERAMTVTTVGRLEGVKGNVYLLAPSSTEKVQAREGQDLVTGQSVLTEGTASTASVVGSAATFQMAGDGVLVFGAAPSEISTPQGRLEIFASRTAVVSTAHARIEAGPGHFLLHARPESTYFESRRGVAQFAPAATGKPAAIVAGQFAVAAIAPGVDQARIDKAIKDGVEYLKQAPSPPYPNAGIPNSDALILLTLIHAGVPETDARLQELLKSVLKAPLERTYTVALQAMVLEELDRVKYQPRIVDCAKFLIDNQCRNGQWSYGTPTTLTGGAFADPRPDVATSVKLDAAGRRIKPKIVKKIAVQKMRDGPAEGDNSNAQYAALGLRACYDAGVLVPQEVLQLALRWWRECQYADKEDKKTPYNGRGWCYHDGKGKVNGGDCCRYTYASMTAGAVGSLVIYDFLLGRDWKSDPGIRSGLEWLTANYSTAWNYKWGKEIPGDPENQGAHFYYLYALERLGTFMVQEKLGKHEWYPDGATVILERQRADGSWIDITLENSPVWDTCFSILFLRRATRPLVDVPSVDRYQKR